MKKIVIAMLAVSILGACLPFTPTQAPGPNVPTVDIAGTTQAGAQTSVAQTLTALPTRTVVGVLLATATTRLQYPVTSCSELPRAHYV